MKGRFRGSNYYTHHVELKIEGFRIERLINKALDRQIRIKDLQYLSETELICSISIDDLEAFKKLAGHLYRISVVKNVGKEYKLKLILKKPFMLFLVAVTITLVITQSRFVKTIEISGYKGIPEEEIRECLDEAGISEGSYIPSIDWHGAEKYIYHIFPEVSWLQLVYDGRKVILNISEGEIIADNKDQEGKEKYYCNIIATEDGYIDNINTYRGIALVGEGDYVQKGQVIILGCVPIKEKYHREDAQTEYYVRSAGEVWAKVPYRLTFTQDLYNKKGQVKSKKEINEKGQQQLREWCRENLPEKAEILNKDLNFSYKENIIEVGVTLEIRQQIGEEQEILIGQKNSDSSGH